LRKEKAEQRGAFEKNLFLINADEDSKSQCD